MKEHPPSNTSIQRVWGLARVSTDEQAQRENNSIGMQKSYCEQYVALQEIHGWKLIRVIEELGHSAGNLNRPGIQELIEAIEAGQVDVILVYKLDRLTRSLRDFFVLWEIMQRHNVNFVSATESFDTTTAIGRVILHVILIFAQFEREQTAQRLRDKAAQAARKGERHPGLPPYGYDPEPTKRSLVINAQEAKVVRLIFKWAIDLPGAAAVAHALNKAGHRTRTLVRDKGTPTEHFVGGKPWNPNKVIKHIQNVAYKAVRLDREGTEHTGNWKPLVTKRIWDQANRAINKQETKSKHSPKRENFTNKAQALLKGILFCGHCNLSMSPKAGGKKTAEGDTRPYYTCQSIVQFGAQSKCQLRNITATGFDAFMIRLIGEFGKNPELIKQTVKASQKNKSKSVRPLKSRLRELKTEFREISGQIENCLKLARNKESGSFTSELLAEANALSERKQVLQREIDSLKVEIDYCRQTSNDETLIAKALCNFEQACGHLTFEERVEVIGLLVKAIKVELITPSSDELGSCSRGDSIPESIKWYRLKIDFQIKDTLLQAANAIPGTPSKSLTARTEVTIIAGLTGTDWSKGGFVVNPFTMDHHRLETSSQKVRFPLYKRRHPLISALKWTSILEANSHLTPSDIAKQVDLSVVRVRQILRLVKLHPQIQNFLVSSPLSMTKRKFSERSLREFVALTPEAQLERFRQKWPNQNLGSN